MAHREMKQGIDGLELPQHDSMDEAVQALGHGQPFRAGATNIMGWARRQVLVTPLFMFCGVCDLEIADVSNIASLLSAGVITSSCGEVGDFVLEWRLGSRTGPVVLVSGSGSDPDIQTQHPFTNEPVSAGTLYAVMRWVEVDGVVYGVEAGEGVTETHDDFDCINPAYEEIDAISCGTSYNADAYYDYILDYNAVTSSSDKSREFLFELDASTNYLAWAFTGFTVADQLQMFYCTSSDPVGVSVTNWIIGQNAGSTNYTTDPIIHSAIGQTRSVANLTSFSYNTGDYIRIRITGSVTDPDNENTNWVIKLKCLEEFDCNLCDCEDCIDDWQTPDLSTIDMSWDAGLCAYVVSYNTLAECPSMLSSDMALYIGSNNPGSVGSAVSISPSSHFLYSPITTNTVVLPLFYNTTLGAEQTDILSGCSSMNGFLTFSKTGSTFLFEFTDSTDYADLKAEINAQLAILSGGYSSDNTTLGYYRSIQIWLYTSLLGTCGDNLTNYGLHFHYSASVTFDDINMTIEIGAVNITNNYTAAECTYNTGIVNTQVVNNINATANQSDFSHITPIQRSPNQVRALYLTETSLAETVRTDTVGIPIDRDMFNVCEISEDFCQASTNVSVRRTHVLRKYRDRVTLTDPSTHESRLANWKLERATGNMCDADYELIYEVEDGVVVYPIES